MSAIEEQAARKREQGAANESAVLTVLAGAGDRGLPPGRELAELAGLPPRTATAAVARLEARGLVRREGRRRVRVTAAGRSEVGALESGLDVAPALGRVIACLPAEALRAFARLQLAAVPARWHLCGEYTAGWPGFIALGPTKTGKTSIASLVCRVYGLDELRAIKAAFRETPGSLLGRRTPDATSATGWRVERSAVLALPYLCVDEYDKASRELQAAAGGLLLGATADELEGERIELRPTVYVTMNTGREGLGALHAAHVRRSVVLDTTPLRGLLGDLDRDVDRLFGGGIAIPRVSLDRLRPPVPRLPRELRELLRSELRAGLTDDGWDHSDVEPLARIALGRAALTQGPLEQAVLETVYDYLTCAATIGHAQENYSARLAHQLSGSALGPDPDAIERQRVELADSRRCRERDRARERDELIEARARVAQMLDELIDRLDLRRLKGCSASQRVDARGIAERLREVRGQVTSARSVAALETADNRGRDPARRAAQLLDQIDAERATRGQIAARVAPVQRSRSVERATLRDVAAHIQTMLPGAHGPDLVSLEQQSRQLEQAPPMSDAKKRRGLSAFQARQAGMPELAQRLEQAPPQSAEEYQRLLVAADRQRQREQQRQLAADRQRQLAALQAHG